MKLSRFLQTVFLLLMLLVFAVAGVFEQASLALRQSVFSEKYLQTSFGRGGIEESIAALATGMLDNMDRLVPVEERGGELDRFIHSARKSLRDNNRWIELEAPRIISGLYGYFVGSSRRGPVINIAPVKDACVDILAEQAVADIGGQKQLMKMIQEAKIALSQYPKGSDGYNAVIDRIMDLSQLESLGVSRDDAVQMADMIARADNLPAGELLKYAATGMIRDKIGFAEIKDQLDLNLLFETIYGQKENPVSGVASVIQTVKNGVFSSVAMLFLATLLIVVTGAYSIKSILRWCGAGLFVSGAIGAILCGVSTLANARLISAFKDLSQQSGGLDIAPIQSWALAYVHGVQALILRNALVFTAFGIAAVAASFFIDRLTDGLRADSRIAAVASKVGARPSLLLGVRIGLVLLLIAAIPLSLYINSNRINASVAAYGKIQEKVAPRVMSTDKALGIALNAQKLIDALKGAGLR